LTNPVCGSFGGTLAGVGLLRLSPTAFDDPESAHGRLTVDAVVGGSDVGRMTIEF